MHSDMFQGLLCSEQQQICLISRSQLISIFVGYILMKIVSFSVMPLTGNIYLDLSNLLPLLLELVKYKITQVIGDSQKNLGTASAVSVLYHHKF